MPVEEVKPEQRWGGMRSKYLVKGVAAFGNDVWFFAREAKTEAEGLETDGAVVLVVGQVAAGDDGDGCSVHVCKRMVVAGRGGGGVDGGRPELFWAEEGEKGPERRLWGRPRGSVGGSKRKVVMPTGVG